jgi:hypothetical protein
MVGRIMNWKGRGKNESFYSVRPANSHGNFLGGLSKTMYETHHSGQPLSRRLSSRLSTAYALYCLNPPPCWVRWRYWVGLTVLSGRSEAYPITDGHNLRFWTIFIFRKACVWIHHHFVDLFLTPETGVKINSARFVPSSFMMSTFRLLT